ncbi:MAG: DNA-directed RNA polymerase subunit omega [Synergistaceae bacterium]|jgi:DNA-directed RNA polymerase omega subunit|nr:DNA-directed RNA polymerase subunit omega [Synergistaceae bacterium]
MIYTDLEKIYKLSDVENKYALAMVISTRARLLSEQKGRQLDGEGSERYITHAIEEIEDGRLNIKSTFTRQEGSVSNVSQMGEQ